MVAGRITAGSAWQRLMAAPIALAAGGVVLIGRSPVLPGDGPASYLSPNGQRIYLDNPHYRSGLRSRFAPGEGPPVDRNQSSLGRPID